MTEQKSINALGREAMHQLANVTKTTSQFTAITPRWASRFLDYKGLESGTYRVNRVVRRETPLDILCSQDPLRVEISQGYTEYQTTPREYQLDSISAVINADTKITDLYSSPYDQALGQIALAIESLRRCQESQLVSNDEHGLLKNIDDSQCIQTRNGRSTPDDLDELLPKVWKEPSFSLVHPRATAASQRETTRRGASSATANLHGGTSILWRGTPLIPSDKLFVDGLKSPKSQDRKTNTLLARFGESKCGMLGLYQEGLLNEQSRGLPVCFYGIDDNDVVSYSLSFYCSAAILVDDAIAALEDVGAGEYYDYK